MPALRGQPYASAAPTHLGERRNNAEELPQFFTVWPCHMNRSDTVASIDRVPGFGVCLGVALLREDTRKGNRPSFASAAPPEEAEPLYDDFCAAVAARGVSVERGVFGADMAVELIKDGPVTIVLDI